MKVGEYAEHRRVHERTVYRWIKLGLPVERKGSVTRVVVEDADRWDEIAEIKKRAELAATGAG